MIQVPLLLLALAGKPQDQGGIPPERRGAGSEAKSQAGWWVSVRVVEAGTGRPLEGVRGMVLYRRVPYAWMIAGACIRTDAEGWFKDLVSFPDTHVLYASEMAIPNVSSQDRKGAAPRFGQLYRPFTVTGPEGDTTAGTFTLGPASTARVTVTDEKGGRVSGATVVAVSEDAPHPIQFLDCPRTDEEGSLEYLGLGEGSWRILVCKRGIGVASADLPNLKWGETEDLALKLGTSGDLYVRGLLRKAGVDTEPKSLSAWMWEVYDARGKLVSCGPVSPHFWGFKSMDELPTSRVDPAFVYAGSYAPGRYRVLARSPKPPPRTTTEFVRDCIEATEEVVIESGKEARVRLTLDLQPPTSR